MFILDNLDGKLSTQFFDRRGSGFAQWYAQDNRSNPMSTSGTAGISSWSGSKTASGTVLRKKKRPTCSFHIPKRTVRVWSTCWMSGFSSIWKRNLQMTPRSGWRGQRKENQLSFLTGTVPVLLRFRTRRQDGCKVQIMDRLVPRA